MWYIAFSFTVERRESRGQARASGDLREIVKELSKQRCSKMLR
jgi:hypothetical protein